LGINGETETVFNADGSIKFFNINAARPFGSNETICRQTLVSLLDSTGVSTIYLNTKYKFTSKERDVETGYDYFACLPKSERRRKGARYYDSRIGRWLQVDPLTDLSSSISPYAYCFNNPLNYTDPDGKWPWDEPNYIWDDELGRWRLRSIDEILAITGREKLNKYSVEHNGDNSLATTLLVTGVSTIAIGTTTVLGGLLGLITIGLSGDTDPQQRQLLMNEGAENAIDKVIEGSEQGKVSSSKQRHREGGEEQANKDFDDIVNAGGSSVQEYPNGVRTTKTPEGTHVTVRPSKEGSPTLEIIRPTGKVIKIRYK